MPLAAACLVAIVGAVAIAPRLVNRSTSPPVVVPAAITARNCTLPVLAGLVAPGAPGYIDTSTGKFRKDHDGVAGLPGGATARAYDTVMHRWVPVPFALISPDGLSYAYTVWTSATQADLHVYRLDTRSDSIVLTDPDGMSVFAWLQDGIHFYTGRDTDIFGQQVYSTTTGKVTNGGPSKWPTPLPGDPSENNLANFHTIGYTTDGHGIFWFVTQDSPGDPDWVFYETRPGARVYIYKGTIGDDTDFAPGAALADRLGIWFSDSHAASRVWHWDPATGLTAIRLKGVALGITVVPAGACF